MTSPVMTRRMAAATILVLSAAGWGLVALCACVVVRL
jgi:hypothetical protein